MHSEALKSRGKPQKQLKGIYIYNTVSLRMEEISETKNFRRIFMT